MIHAYHPKGRRMRDKDAKPRSLPDRKSNTAANRHETFCPQGVHRLSLAIINRAVCDLLDKGRHSPGAERWLLSREFDHLHELLG